MQGPWDSKVDIWTFGCLVRPVFLPYFPHDTSSTYANTPGRLCLQVYEFMLGVPIFSRQHATMAPDDYHLAQIIKFTGEEFPPELVRTYKRAPEFLDMETGQS
jgi:hypothetical protein